MTPSSRQTIRDLLGLNSLNMAGAEFESWAQRIILLRRELDAEDAAETAGAAAGAESGAAAGAGAGAVAAGAEPGDEHVV